MGIDMVKETDNVNGLRGCGDPVYGDSVRDGVVKAGIYGFFNELQKHTVDNLYDSATMKFLRERKLDITERNSEKPLQVYNSFLKEYIGGRIDPCSVQITLIDSYENLETPEDVRDEIAALIKMSRPELFRTITEEGCKLNNLLRNYFGVSKDVLDERVEEFNDEVVRKTNNPDWYMDLILNSVEKAKDQRSYNL